MNMRKIQLTLLAVGTLAVTAFADDAAKIKADMQASMNATAKCVLKKDMAGAEKIIRANFAKDFVGVDSTGKKSTLDEWLSGMKQQVQMTKSMDKMVMKVLSVKVNGNKADTTEETEVAMTMDNPQTKKPMKIRVVQKSASKLEKRGSKWMIVSSKDSAQKTWVDGKEIKM